MGLLRVWAGVGTRWLCGARAPTLSMTSQKCIGASPKRSFSSSTLRISLQGCISEGCSASAPASPCRATPTALHPRPLSRDVPSPGGQAGALGAATPRSRAVPRHPGQWSNTSSSLPGLGSVTEDNCPESGPRLPRTRGAPRRPHRSGLKLNWCSRWSASSERYSLMKRSLLP